MSGIRFLEPASAELEKEIAYYDQQTPGLGDNFEQEVRFAASLIVEHPHIGAALTKKLRKLRLRTFPFNIIYAVDQDDIIIVAVAHYRRRPDYWRTRVEKRP